MNKPATRWTVRVDWTRGSTTTDTAATEELLEQLADLHPALHVDEPEQPDQPPRFTVTVSVEATSLRQATATGLRRVEDAAGEKADGVEAIRHDEARRRLAQPRIPELVGYAEIADMLDVTRQRAGQLADRDDFPPPAVTTRTGPLRIKAQVDAWASTWDRKGGRPRKAPASND